jgi:hypothetical protein
MSLRRFLKFLYIVLMVIVCARGVMAWRQLGEVPSVSTARLIGASVVGALVLTWLVLQMTGILRKTRGEVPKRPLGLDS